MSRIVFCCGTNLTRSPMAAAYFNSLLTEAGVTDIEVCSAGIAAPHGATITWEARETLHRKNLEPLAFGTTQLLPKLIKSASLIVCMTEEQQEKIQSMFVSAKGKVRPLMSIVHSSRPVREPPKGDLQATIACLELMIPALRELVKIIA